VLGAVVVQSGFFLWPSLHGFRSRTPCDGLTLTWSAYEADWTAMGAAMPPEKERAEGGDGEGLAFPVHDASMGSPHDAQARRRGPSQCQPACLYSLPRRAKAVRGVSLPLVDFRADG
jgi:hypothetical protein